MINFLFLVTLLIYLAAGIFQTLSLAIGNRSEASLIRPAIERLAFGCTLIGFAFLTLFIALWWLQQGHFPMTHWTDSTAFFAWAITVIYLIIVRLTHLRTLGSFVMPVAFIAILISYSFATHTAALPEPLAKLLAAGTYDAHFSRLCSVHRCIWVRIDVSDSRSGKSAKKRIRFLTISSLLSVFLMNLGTVARFLA